MLDVSLINYSVSESKSDGDGEASFCESLCLFSSKASPRPFAHEYMNIGCLL